MELPSCDVKHALENLSTPSLKRRKLSELQGEEEDGMMNIIPTEVLGKILQYLSLGDRKHGKLVCSKWYDILTERNFQKKEKIVCRGIYSCAEIASTLMTFRCSLYSLVFQNVDFKDYPLEFWKQRGAEIIELDFTLCTVSKGRILEMMKYCVNLTNWTVLLINKEKIRRPNLINTQIEVFDNDKPTHLLKELITVFPKIKRLYFTKVMGTGLKGSLLKVRPNYMPKSLTLVCHDGLRNVNNLSNETLSCTTLQQFGIHAFNIDHMTSLQLENLLSFVSKQTMLKKISMGFTSRSFRRLKKCGSFKMKLLRTLFNNCPDLRCMCFIHKVLDAENYEVRNEEEGRFIIDLALMKKLVHSKLEILTIDDDSLELGTDLLIGKDLVNYNLKSLSLTLSESQVSPLEQIFRGWKHWRVCGPLKGQHSIIHTMPQFQTKLVSLDIKIDETSEVELCSIFLSVSRFTNLRYLQLHTNIPSQGLLLNLPNLEYFSLSLGWTADRIKLTESLRILFNTIPTSFPKLKFLDVRHRFSHRVPKSSIMKMCSLLKQLEVLDLSEVSVKKFSDEELEDLFQSSQSLRFFSNVNLKAIYDRSQNKVFQWSVINFHDYQYRGVNFNSEEMELYGFGAIVN